MPIFSHPDRKLKDHLENVKHIGLKVFNLKSGINFKYDNEKIKTALEHILYFHDIGKATKFFQDYLKNLECSHSQELINHSLISACIGAYKFYTKINDENLTAIVFGVIRKHHGDLQDFEEILGFKKAKIKILKTQFESIDFTEFSELKDLEFDELMEIIDELLFFEIFKNIENFTLINFLFSILTYSDKTDVIFGRSDIRSFSENISVFIDIYKKEKFKNADNSKVNLIREEIYEESIKNLTNDKIFSLNVPTGAGKTLTALNIAFNLVKKDSSLKRVIYALPFTSIVDQTEKVLKEIFELNQTDADDYLTVHHHLADVKYRTDEGLLEGDRAQFLIENWDKPLILTTFWQLFHSIISNKNSQLRKFHNIANSVIILDEVQTIPYKYWELVNFVFKKLTEILNCKILFLTATMPLIFLEDKKEILPLIKFDKRKKYFKNFSRYKIKVLKNGNIRELTLDELFEIAKNDISKNNDKSFLFVFNTIKSSIEFYEKLKDEFSNRELVYLSTNILPIVRKERIKQIKNNPSNKIIVSTQLIEAGVDIDLDIVYRDFAPLDSIIQTAGRCNRNNIKNIGKVVLFKLKDENERFFSSYIYKSLTLLETENLFKDREEILESELFEIINEYYKALKNQSSQNESRKVIENITNLEFEKLSHNFKLIEEIPEFLMFFEYDKNASHILEEFRNIFEIDDRFERKSELLKIKSKFFQYVLSVKLTSNTMSYYSSFEELGGIKIVPKDFIKSIYSDETGLKREFSMFV